MENIKFRRKVSKGSRYNQIYVPKELENVINVGDEVEVILLKKELCYSTKLKISKFKENLIKQIFSFLTKHREINSMFVVGSFLFETIDYNDIDLILIVSEETNMPKLKNQIYKDLIEKFNQKFHIIIYTEKELEDLLIYDPITISIFSIHIGNKKLIKRKKMIDKMHLKFLLMMPKDLLKIRLPSRIFFDNLRRLETIEKFLKNKSLDIISINGKIKNLIGGDLFKRIKMNEEINKKEIDLFRKIIQNKIRNIEKLLK